MRRNPTMGWCYYNSSNLSVNPRLRIGISLRTDVSADTAANRFIFSAASCPTSHIVRENGQQNRALYAVHKVTVLRAAEAPGFIFGLVGR